MSVTTRLETPIFFDASGDDLFGVFTRPDREANGIAVLTLFGGGPFPTLGKNQVRVRLTRQLAELGYHVLRIDYRGIGESGGEPRVPTLDNLWVDDAVGAIRWLRDQGFDRVLVVGVCFGARTALAVFPEIKDLAGMVLIAAPVGEANHRETIIAQPWSWYLKRAMSPRAMRLILGGDTTARRRRSALKERVQRTVGRGTPALERPKQAHASPQFLEPMATLLQSQVPVLLLYGRGDDFFSSFERSLKGRLGQLIDASPSVSVRITDESLAGLASIETQEIVLNEVNGFAREVARRGSHAPSGGEHGGLRLE